MNQKNVTQLRKLNKYDKRRFIMLLVWHMMRISFWSSSNFLVLFNAYLFQVTDFKEHKKWRLKNSMAIFLYLDSLIYQSINLS